MRLPVLLPFGLFLLACGGEVRDQDHANGEGGATDNPDELDAGGNTAVGGDAPTGTVGEPGCFDAVPGEGVGTSNCGPGFDHFDEPAACEATTCISVTETHLSPTDGCEWTLGCDGGRTLVVECDGENDGTNTSLCSCFLDGEFVKDAGLVQGEGVDACKAGYINCVDPACAE
ncbi:MAG: hypothetical protein JNK04_25075 [Myxococcales bacterium]|nr:hypothetical protein [Myxococcales bacterium]